MSSIKTYSCKYCEIDGLLRKEFIKHTKTEDHKTLMFNAFHIVKAEQKIVAQNKCGKANRVKGPYSITMDELNKRVKLLEE